MQGHRFLRTFVIVLLLTGLVLSGAGQGRAVLAQEAVITTLGPDTSAMSTAFTYQGQLKVDGAPTQGSFRFTFTLWDAAQNGNQMGTPENHDVVVTNGMFTVTLNKTGEFGADAFTGAARWLEIQVCKVGSLPCLMTTLSPRQEITAVPYALSLVPGSVIHNHAPSTGWTPGIHLESDNGSGLIGISRGSSAGVVGDSRAATGEQPGVEGVTAHGYAGVYGHSARTGVFGESSAAAGNGAGVQGNNSSTGEGVFGFSTSGIGVRGKNSSPGSPAVLGENTGAGGVGVKGTSAGDAVLGESTSSGNGVHGTTTGNWPSAGVLGEHKGNSDGFGVKGTSSLGSGVYGYSDAVSCEGGSNCIGVRGEGYVGVLGRTGHGVGLVGEATDVGIALKLAGGPGDLIQAWNRLYTNLQFKVANGGNVYADGTYTSPASDFAEMLPAVAGLEPGDVLAIGAGGRLERCTAPYQTSVAGINSTKPGFLGGSAEEGQAADKVPLAITGVVPVKAAAENGPIHAGDLLTTSSTPGHAMKASPRVVNGVSLYPTGTIIGKALENLASGTGTIQMLVTLQ